MDVIAAKLFRLRKQCLVHRFLYYVLCSPLIDDPAYDLLERELVAMCQQYPEIAAATPLADDCPTKRVGSSNMEDYPKELQCVAYSLIEYNPLDNPEWWDRVTAPRFEAEIQDILEEHKHAEPITYQQQSFFG